MQNIEQIDKPKTVTKTISLRFGYSCDCKKYENRNETYCLYNPNGVFLGEYNNIDDLIKAYNSDKEEFEIEEEIRINWFNQLNNLQTEQEELKVTIERIKNRKKIKGMKIPPQNEEKLQDIEKN